MVVTGSLLVSVVVNWTVRIGHVFMVGWHCLIDYVGRIWSTEVYCAVSQLVAVLKSSVVFNVWSGPVGLFVWQDSFAWLFWLFECPFTFCLLRLFTVNETSLNIDCGMPLSVWYVSLLCIAVLFCSHSFFLMCSCVAIISQNAIHAWITKLILSAFSLHYFGKTTVCTGTFTQVVCNRWITLSIL
jgi:hypothetical protein